MSIGNAVYQIVNQLYNRIDYYIMCWLIFSSVVIVYWNMETTMMIIMSIPYHDLYYFKMDVIVFRTRIILIIFNKQKLSKVLTIFAVYIITYTITAIYNVLLSSIITNNNTN